VAKIVRIKLAPELAFLFRLGTLILNPPIEDGLATLTLQLLQAPPLRGLA
jgi:hypothetical protein